MSDFSNIVIEYIGAEDITTSSLGSSITGSFII